MGKITILLSSHEYLIIIARVVQRGEQRHRSVCRRFKSFLGFTFKKSELKYY